MNFLLAFYMYHRQHYAYRTGYSYDGLHLLLIIVLVLFIVWLFDRRR